MELVVRDLRRNRRDAELLAELWNGSDAGWPGGFTRGVTQTTSRVLEEIRNSDALEMVVVQESGGRGRLLGYGDLQAQAGQQRVAYIPLLNVHPDFHGRGLGRRIIRTLLERTARRGYAQLTLDTWAGNRKAVPLYKKTGFFWVPETDVFMMNFIPTIVAHPLAATLFAAHDWYQIFDRTLELRPDQERWRGIDAFRYRFAHGDTHLEMMFDRHAEHLAAVDTGNFAVSCVAGSDELAVGRTHHLTVEVRNRRRQPLAVSLIVRGNQHIPLQVNASHSVTGTWRAEYPFVIDPEIAPRRRGEPAVALEATVVVDGVPIALAGSVRAVQPLQTDYSGQRLIPGRWTPVNVTLRNRLPEPVAGTVGLDAHPQLEWQAPSAPLQVPAEGWTTVPLKVRAAGHGTHETTLRIAAHEAGRATSGRRAASPAALALRPVPIALRAAAPGMPVVSRDRRRNRVTVDGDHGSVVAHGDGGALELRDSAGRARGRSLLPELGPPFAEWRRVPPVCQVELADERHGVTLTISVVRPEQPGLRVQRVVTITAGPLITIADSVHNETGQPLSTGVRRGGRSGRDAFRYLALPLRAGFVHRPVLGWGDWPESAEDIPRAPSAYAERWCAAEADGHVVGTIWQDPKQLTIHSGLAALEERRISVAAHDRIALPPLWLVAGHGDWRLVRHYYSWLAGDVEAAGGKRTAAVAAEPRDRPGSTLRIGFEHGPLLLVAGRSTAAVRIENLRDKAIQGTLAIAAGGRAKAKIGFDPATATVSAVNMDRSHTLQVAIRPDAAAREPLRAVPVTFTLDDGVQRHEFADTAIFAGNGRQPRVTERDGSWRLANGVLEADIDARFLGSVHALRVGAAENGGAAREQLVSAYPTASDFVGINPWYGGIHPFVGSPDDHRFTGQVFRARAVERRGRSGLRWAGCLVSATIGHRDLRWLRLECEYLTVGGSNLLAVVVRAVNRSTAEQQVKVGVAAWPRPAPRWQQVRGLHATPPARGSLPLGAPAADVAERRSGPYDLWGSTTRLAAAVDPRGRGLAMVTTSRDGKIDFLDTGTHGFHMSAPFQLQLPPRARREHLAWIVAVSGAAQARDYAPLERLEALP